MPSVFLRRIKRNEYESLSLLFESEYGVKGEVREEGNSITITGPEGIMSLSYIPHNPKYQKVGLARLVIDSDNVPQPLYSFLTSHGFEKVRHKKEDRRPF